MALFGTHDNASSCLCASTPDPIPDWAAFRRKVAAGGNKALIYMRPCNADFIKSDPLLPKEEGSRLMVNLALETDS
jgi:hypothetical protein